MSAFRNKAKAWVSAADLKVGTKVLLSDGKCATIEKLEVETLEQAETTYNFEVEDFHTYYVGNGVCMHNMNGVPCDSNRVKSSASKAKNWLGKDSKAITNENGDKVFFI